MQDRLKRLRFRAWHRGTREADYMIGGFFDRYSPGWDEAEVEWFEAVVEEDDVDIMAWALGTGHPPAHLDRPAWIAAMRRLDYIPLP
ncbi:succinate dehydrogenase assembly factor 2 [Sphingopyxis granuli]|uniref:succinate dehydrogenase assembly factor 2 n=1 Tax=Sphingopyxis granuli TaxID=267128 RepID=UPI000835AB19|nr:succinate dehydrogenase assembly factor 2 [Sphingopyxis granuli]